MNTILQIVLGAVLGALASLGITHIYYRRSSTDLDAQVKRLSAALDALDNMSKAMWDSIEVTKNRVVMGTPDDPEYPYK